MIDQLLTHCRSCGFGVQTKWWQPPVPGGPYLDPIAEARARLEAGLLTGHHVCARCDGNVTRWRPHDAVYRDSSDDFYRVRPGQQRVVGTAEQVFAVCMATGKAVSQIAACGRSQYYVDIGPRHASALNTLNTDLRLGDG